MNLRILSAGENASYGSQPIPNQRDSEIRALLSSSDPSDLVGDVRQEHFAVLRAYAERMASLSVRTGDLSILRSGLTALGLAGLADGSREAIALLPLYDHAAGLVGADPERVFKDVGAMLRGPAARALEGFLRRSAEDRSLEAMGYRTAADSDGFRYERQW